MINYITHFIKKCSLGKNNVPQQNFHGFISINTKNYFWLIHLHKHELQANGDLHVIGIESYDYLFISINHIFYYNGEFALVSCYLDFYCFVHFSFAINWFLI